MNDMSLVYDDSCRVKYDAQVAYLNKQEDLLKTNRGWAVTSRWPQENLSKKLIYLFSTMIKKK